MDGIILRRARQADIPQVCRIWSASFGDSPELVERLMNGFGLADNLTVAEERGQVCSAMAAFDGLRIGGLPASYIYALCTDPGCRGRGFGSALVKRCALLALERGAEMAFLHPASPSLAAWYSGMGFIPSPTVSVRAMVSGTGAGAHFVSGRAAGAESSPVFGSAAGSVMLPVSRSAAVAEDGIAVTPCTAGEYLRLRASSPAEVSPQLMAVQELFCSLSGGALLLLRGRDFQGAACCELTEAGLLIRELMCPAESEKLCISALKEYFGANSAPILLLSSRVSESDAGNPADAVPNIMYMLRTSGEFKGELPVFPFILD